ncbi:MAG: hypothetical protein RBS43_10900, partial [Candidatus Cloacimonas sp.]|nr:hypothetical protein [Candidatus Cloacimonas sp.]
KTFCHSRGGGNPALMNPIRDDTNKALQYRHISSFLTYLIYGLDSCLRACVKTPKPSVIPVETGIQP